MKILVVGSGGREHTMCWKFAQSSMVEKVYCAPGNAGIANNAECIDIAVTELEKLADFAETNDIALTIAGPEIPLCAGIVDVFNKRGLKIFGPDKNAAQLEGSKTYAKNFMKKYDIPTGESQDFSNKEKAITYVKGKFKEGVEGIVVKADGLAAGKGVIVALEEKVALDAVEDCFEGLFGNAGSCVLIEECLFGEEVSILALVDGKTITALASSQDHKRLLEKDCGPNTGGMGAYSPAPVVELDTDLQKIIEREVLANFLRGIQEEELYFRGIIYAGVMVTKKGPKVLEFNVRFGDPETQAVLVRMNSDLVDVMLKTSEGKLDEVKLDWSDDVAVCVVMASGGYPGAYTKGDTISGLKEAESTGAIVFHAGTSLENGNIVNSGGRVLGVTARGVDIKEAIKNAYSAVDKIKWNGAIYRKDIAYRALNR